MSRNRRASALAALAAMVACAYGAGAAKAQSLPEGAGRGAVEALCSGCHGTNLIVRSSGYTRAQWEALSDAMIDLSADPEARTAILDYLADAFPPNAKRAAARAPGDMAIAFEEWVVPTRGPRPRDPVEARLAFGGTASAR